MSPLTTLAPLTVALLTLAVSLPAAADSPKQRTTAASLAQTERMSVDLRRGMSLEEVRALLGKPRRTALRDVGAAGTAPGSLQWVYSWDDSDRSSLRVEFAPKGEGAWSVTSWEWARF